MESSQSQTLLTSSTQTRSRRRTAAEMSETPMIIDISLDRSGNQVYQLNTIKRNSYENNNNNNNDNENNSKRSIDDDEDNENDISSPTSSTSSTRSSKRPRSSSSSMRKIKDEPQDDSTDSAEDVWCPAVETSFQEALEIIPKQGLHKIKVCGRACGRNELISDYIEHCTGKYRTRKQVSSHIQVVKNLGRDRRLIDLILVGPPQTEETISRFNETFFGILMKKQSGGVIDPENRLPKQLLELPAVMSPTSLTKNTSYIQRKSSKIKLNNPLCLQDLWNIKVNLKGYNMKETLGDSQKIVSRLASAESCYLGPLRIRSNADLSRRFPTLISLVNSIKEKIISLTNKTIEIPASIPPVPVLHCMVKMVAPPLFHQDLSNIEYEVKGQLQLTDLPQTDESCYCCLTLCYTSGELVSSSYEKIISKLNKRDYSLDLELTVGGSKFWQKYYNDIKDRLNLRKNNNNSSGFTLKNITMQQVIFNVVPKEYKAPIPDKYTLEDIPRSKIRGIVLWEHLRVKEISQAVTTVRNIHMPVPSILPVPQLPKVNINETIIKQEFEATSPPSEHDLNNYLNSTSAIDITVPESPQNSFNNQTSLLATPHNVSHHPTLSNVTTSNSLSSLQQDSYYDDYQPISVPNDINGLFPTPVSNGCTPVITHGGSNGGQHGVRFLSALTDDDGEFVNNAPDSTLSSVLEMENQQKINGIFDSDVNNNNYWFNT